MKHSEVKLGTRDFDANRYMNNEDIDAGLLSQQRLAHLLEKTGWE